jgi:AraC-like DNA-binding protein
MTEMVIGARQTFHERLPTPSAGSHVACIWIQRIAAGPLAYPHRTVPNGSVELTYELGTRDVLVIGPQRGPILNVLTPGATVVGVRFHPGATPEALGVPACELSGQTIELASIWGKRAVILAERLAASGSAATIAQLMEREVTGPLAGAWRRDPVAAAALDALRRIQTVDLRRLAADLFVSDRKLRRRCRTAFGHGAKTMHRVVRFQRFLALHGRNPRATEDGLGRLAWDAGFADQAHLTRECVALTGLPPRRFLLETSRSCGPSHDHKARFAPFLPAPTEAQ